MTGRTEGIGLLLRQYPDAALEAIGAYQLADRWVSEGQGAEVSWVRYPLFDGRRMLDGECPHTPADMDREPLGFVRPLEVEGDEAPRWGAYVDDERIGTFAMPALAQRAVDEALQGAGWVTP